MRPTQFKRGGGGFLNGVEALITGYSFVVGETSKIKKGDRKGQDFTPITLVPTFRLDGADEDVSQRLLVGGADNFEGVDEDGLNLNIGEGRIGASTEAAIFIESLCNPTGGGEGFPADRFDEDETIWNLEPMIGTRVRLVQITNAEKTKRQGPQVNATTGKSYDRKDLKVESVLELPGVAGKAKAAPKAAVKGAKAPKAADVTELAHDTVRAIMEANTDKDDNVLPLPFAKLKMKVFGTFGSAHPQKDQRDAVLKYLGDSTNLVGIDGITYDGKKALISAAA